MRGFVVALLLAAAPAAAGDEPRIVLLIGWDGAQRDHVQECLDRGELPTLARLQREGAYVEIDIEGTTDTKAGWAQILTGYRPEVTGVYSNRRYGPIPEGLTVFERLEDHFGSHAIRTFAVIGKKGNVDADGPKKTRVKKRRANAPRKRKPEGRIVVEDGVRYRVVPGKPWFLTKERMDLFENGLKKDHLVADRAMELLEEHQDRRIFFFIHFAEVDHSGHKHGENSSEYNHALISNDYWTGRILKKIDALGLRGKTAVYVTADHGFDEDKRTHRNAPHVFLATNDKRVKRNGMRTDVAPTILERFGLDPGRFEPPLDGVPLTRAAGTAARQ